MKIKRQDIKNTTSPTYIQEKKQEIGASIENDNGIYYCNYRNGRTSLLSDLFGFFKQNGTSFVGKYENKKDIAIGEARRAEYQDVIDIYKERFKEDENYEKRKAIIDTLVTMTGHPTVEHIIFMLKKADPIMKNITLDASSKGRTNGEYVAGERYIRIYGWKNDLTQEGVWDRLRVLAHELLHCITISGTKEQGGLAYNAEDGLNNNSKEIVNRLFYNLQNYNLALTKKEIVTHVFDICMNKNESKGKSVSIEEFNSRVNKIEPYVKLLQEKDQDILIKHFEDISSMIDITAMNKPIMGIEDNIGQKAKKVVNQVLTVLNKVQKGRT